MGRKQQRWMVRRRSVLIGLSGIVLAASAAGLALRSRLNRHRLKTLLSRVVLPEPQLDPTAPLGGLSDEEMQTILALGDILVSPDDADRARSLIQAHVEDRAQQHQGYLDEYRSGVALLDAASANRQGAAARFAGLHLDDRTAVLQSLLWSYRAADTLHRYLEALFLSRRQLAFRRFVVADILSAYYRSPFGWKIVGYSHYPGVPAADPLDYARPAGT